MDETLREDGHVALLEVFGHSTLTAVFLHKRYPLQVSLDCVQHHQKNDRYMTGGR